MVKDVKYIYSVKKRLVWVFYNGRDWGDDNETGLKEGGGIEIESTVLPFTITIITIYYSDTINSQTWKKYFDDNYNLV